MGVTGGEILADSNANGNAKHRLDKFNTYMRSLNEQFLGWAKAQWEAKPTKPWTHGMTDYLRHCVIIRRDFADVVQADTAATSSGQPRSPRPEMQLTIMPLHHTKVVHFIRHGEGFHNIGLMCEDARLTEYGWQQTKGLSTHLANLSPALRIQLIVTSPLTRALETTAGVFGSSQLSASGGVLMHAQDALPNCRSVHEDIYLPHGMRIIAFEGCRERLGPAICDRRSDVKIAEKQFPGIDLSLIQPGPDDIYDRRAPESEHAVQERSAKFLQWLMARPEREIAVVSHCGFLLMTLAAFGHECAASVTDDLHRPFDNCEMRSVTMADAAGAAIIPAHVTHFPGGRRWQTPGPKRTSE